MTKIDIFSGFLGAGKTTLIKKLVKEAYAGEQIVIIENEFGAIGIDGGFLRDAGINVTEMNSGCICCSLVGDFTEALSKVISEYHPTRIVIEPSGVGKLSDVKRAVEQVTTDEVVLNSLVAIADANKCKMYMKNFGEFYNDQIESATTIVLSHTSGAPQKKLEDAVALLREHNAEATMITTPWELLNGKDILAAMERTNTLEQQLNELAHEHEHRHHHDHEEHDEHCTCGHHHHDHDEHDEHCSCGHHHHHDHEEHDEHCSCGHHHHDHDEHDEHCSCGHHHHDHEEHDEHCSCGHHHHHADEVFSSWGVETARKFTKDEISDILEHFDEDAGFGMILRAKGIVASPDGSFIHFDYVPGHIDVRCGSAAVIGRLCVIGSKINENAIAELFGV
ncbi:MAG: GTP-binding protein [Clostridia bacterium]|nr:GTP-binding protein [Clostridia bacterium]